jgi:hypothetical protein
VEKVSPHRAQVVTIRPLPGKLHLVERLIQEREFIECDKITGDDPFLARLVIHSIEQMDDVLDALSEHAVISGRHQGASVKRLLPRYGISQDFRDLRAEKMASVPVIRVQRLPSTSASRINRSYKDIRNRRAINLATRKHRSRG